MKFIDENNIELVLNIPHITRIAKIAKGFLVVSFDSEIVIAKDDNSEKLFNYLAAKAAKDILGNGIENLQNKANDIMQMVANMRNKQE